MCKVLLRSNGSGKGKGRPRSSSRGTGANAHFPQRTNGHSLLLTKSKSLRRNASGARKQRQFLLAKDGQPWGPLLHDKILSSGWALQAALEDRALEGQETSSDAALPALKSARPSTEPSPSLGNLKTPDATSGLKLPSFTLQPDSIKVRVARNSEELKAVAALRVSIFQHFLNPKEKAEKAAQAAKAAQSQAHNSPRAKPKPAKLPRRTAILKERIENAFASAVDPTLAACQGSRRRIPKPARVSATQAPMGHGAKTTTRPSLPAGARLLPPQPLKQGAAAAIASHHPPSPVPSQADDLELKEQWLRKQSGLEAARIYNLGERCLCLLAVYHPKDEEERKALLAMAPVPTPAPPAAPPATSAEGRPPSAVGNLGERLLSPFFRWQAPPVPKAEAGHALEDEDGGLIVGTLNIHFDQPFRPRPVKGESKKAMQIKQQLFKQKRQAQLQQQSSVCAKTESCYIFNLCVSPAFRRQGVASLLLDQAHAIAIKKKVKESFLHVDFGNDAAERLYQNSGYDHVANGGKAWSYIAGSRPRQLMKKFL